MNNSLFTINPYIFNNMWVFDDEAVGLVKEAFVAGADLLLDVVQNRFGRGFSLTFSNQELPEYDYCLDYQGEGVGKGSDFIEQTTKIKAWLCPALFLYYDKAPEKLYVKVKPNTVTDEACPGCGCEPGDGYTDWCFHPEGCGYFKQFIAKE